MLQTWPSVFVLVIYTGAKAMVKIFTFFGNPLGICHPSLGDSVEHVNITLSLGSYKFKVNCSGFYSFFEYLFWIFAVLCCWGVLHFVDSLLHCFALHICNLQGINKQLCWCKELLLVVPVPFLVVNVTFPDDKQNYVHRIGRVERAER